MTLAVALEAAKAGTRGLRQRFGQTLQIRLKGGRNIAAGSLLVTEADGKITVFSTQGWNIYGRECLASNSHIYGQMSRVLQAGRRP